MPSGTTLLISLSSLMNAALIAVSSCGNRACSGAGRTRQIGGKARRPSQLLVLDELTAVLLRAGRLGCKSAASSREAKEPRLLTKRQAAALCDVRMVPTRRQAPLPLRRGGRVREKRAVRRAGACAGRACQGHDASEPQTVVCAPAGASSARPHRRARRR